MMMFGRAFTQNGEVERASRCRGIYMLYGGYPVVHEVEAASQEAAMGVVMSAQNNLDRSWGMGSDEM